RIVGARLADLSRAAARASRADRSPRSQRVLVRANLVETSRRARCRTARHGAPAERAALRAIPAAWKRAARRARLRPMGLNDHRDFLHQAQGRLAQLKVSL